MNVERTDEEKKVTEEKEHKELPMAGTIPLPKPTEEAQSQTRSLVAEAIDKTTKEATDKLDRLIAELTAMKEFLTEDANRVKAEMEQHLNVRKRAFELQETVHNEMRLLRSRIGTPT